MRNKLIESNSEEESKVGIIILNYLTYNLTNKCIDELNNQEYKNFFVIIVDNNSENGSVSKIQKHINERKVMFEIEVVESTYNGGYSFGNNIGAKIAYQNGSKYTIIMNNDIELNDTKLISKLVSNLQIDSNTKLIGPGIIQKNGTSELPLHKNRISSLNYSLTHLFYPAMIIQKKILKNYYRITSPIKVYSVSGSFFIIESNVFDEINYLDEGVFLYGEEMILGEKLFQKGYDVKFNPNINVTHNHSQTISSVFKANKIIRMQYESHRYYFKKFRSDIKPIACVFLLISEFINVYLYHPIIFKLQSLKKKDSLT